MLSIRSIYNSRQPNRLQQLLHTLLILQSVSLTYHMLDLGYWILVLLIMHTNNGKEYFSASFYNFMSSHGMIHQSSCPILLNKMVLQKKNHHLIDTTRTLLTHANAPLKWRGDAVLTVRYLI